jgi:hypothetical protein
MSLAERLADPMPNLPVRYKQSRTLVSESSRSPENHGGPIRATCLADSTASAMAAAAHRMTTGMPRVRAFRRDLSFASSAAPHR